MLFTQRIFLEKSLQWLVWLCHVTLSGRALVSAGFDRKLLMPSAARELLIHTRHLASVVEVSTLWFLYAGYHTTLSLTWRDSFYKARKKVLGSHHRRVYFWSHKNKIRPGNLKKKRTRQICHLSIKRWILKHLDSSAFWLNLMSKKKYLPAWCFLEFQMMRAKNFFPGLIIAPRNAWH